MQLGGSAAFDNLAPMRPPPGLEHLAGAAAARGTARTATGYDKSRAEMRSLLAQVMDAMNARQAAGLALSGGWPAASSDSGSALSAALGPRVGGCADDCSTQDSNGPDLTDTIDGSDTDSVGVSVTTLMVRNLPLHCTQEALLEDWPCFGTYDFLYLPRTSAGKMTLGYAFVNFTSAAHASAFKAKWQRGRLARYGPEQRRLSVSFAAVQGLAANVEQVRAKPVGRMRSRQCKPYVVVDGRQVQIEDF